MAGAYVASAQAEGAASSATIAVTPGTNPTTGNLLWVVVRSDADTTCTVADTRSNTFTPIGSIVEAGTGDELFHFYAKNITGGSSTITATLGAASISRGIYVEEWSGLDVTAPLVDNHEVTDTGANPTTNASNTNGGSAGVLLSFGNQVNGTPGITVGTGMTVRSATAWSTDTARGTAQYRVLSADTSTYTSNFVNPTIDRVNQVAAIFKEQSSPIISVQPASVCLASGGTATFSVVATGTPTYQWQTFSGSWGDIGGATSSSYTTGALTSSDDGKRYRVNVTEGGTTTSNEARVTITKVGTGPQFDGHTSLSGWFST